MVSVFCLALTLLGQAPDATPLGTRIDLKEALLFVPKDYHPRADAVDVIVHLHGASSVLEPAVVAWNPRAVLVEFNRKGLSSVYAEPFSDSALFPRLLDAALREVKNLGLAQQPHVGRVTLSSFSAGFGGVRELLKVPAHYARIDTLVMADSLYAGYEGDPSDHRIDPQRMADFRRFANDAAAGKKTFLLTHSAQVPVGYASTTETADELIRAVGGVVETTHVNWVAGWTQARRCAQGRFLVLGFEGRDADDHVRHLREIARILKAIPETQ